MPLRSSGKINLMKASFAIVFLILMASFSQAIADSSPIDGKSRTAYGSKVRVVDQKTGEVTWEDLNGNVIEPPASETISKTRQSNPASYYAWPTRTSAKSKAPRSSESSFARVSSGFGISTQSKRYSKTKVCLSAGCNRAPGRNGYCSFHHHTPSERRVYCEDCGSIISRQGDCKYCRYKPDYEKRIAELRAKESAVPKFNIHGHEFSSESEREYYRSRHASDVQSEFALMNMKAAQLKGDKKEKSWHKKMLRASINSFKENENRKENAAREGEAWAQEDIIFSIMPPSNIQPGYDPPY